MKKHLILTSLVWLAANTSHALIEDVCSVAARAQNLNSAMIGGAQVTQQQIADYQKALNDECELSKKYLSVQAKIQKKFSVDLTRIALYQTLRFTQRSWYNIAKQSNKPVEKIYHIFASDYSKSTEQQDAFVWDDWAKGVRSLDATVADVDQGVVFDSTYLKKIHRGLFPFFPFITEHGDYAHDPNPGVFKPTETTDRDNYWWELDKPEDIQEAKSNSDRINTMYAQLGLLSPVPENVPDYVGKIISVRLRDDRRHPGQQVQAFHSGHPMLNRQNTELILKMMDTLLAQARAQKPMIWKNRLFTPAQLAYFVQQYYVRVHPFYEGNGRTSRFLQELVMQSFNLPHGASGDLMDIDALSLDEVYYKTAMQATSALLDQVSKCAPEQKHGFFNLGSDTGTADAYDCKVLDDRSNVWAQYDQSNDDSFVDAKSGKSKQQILADLKELDRTTEALYQSIIKGTKEDRDPLDKVLSNKNKGKGIYIKL